MNPILHNTNDADIIAYNKMITEKPKGGVTLAGKLKLQRAWKVDCNELLLSIRTRLELPK